MALTAAQQAELDELEAKYASVSAEPAPAPSGPIAVGEPQPTDEDLEAKYAHLDLGTAPVVEPPKPEPETPSLPSQAGHVLKGAVKGATEATIDLPGNMSQLATPASNWAMDQLAQNSAAESGIRQYLPGLESPVAGALMMFNRANKDRQPGEEMFTPQGKVTDVEAIKPYAEMATSPNFERDAAPWADSARTFANWGIGGLGNAARRVSARPDLFMAGGAVAGEAIADQFGSDNEIFEVAGAVPALVAALRKGKGSPMLPGEQKALDIIDEYSAGSKPTQNKLKELAPGSSGNMLDWNSPTPAGYVDDLYDAAKDPGSVLVKAREALAEGEKGTLADITRDQGIFDVEGGLTTPSGGLPSARARLKLIEEERAQQIADEVAAPFGDANALDAQAAAAARVNQVGERVGERTARRVAGVEEAAQPQLAELAAVDEAAQARMAQADDAAAADARAEEEAAQAQAAAGQEIATDLRPEQTSAQMAAAARAAREAERVVEKKAWTAFEESPPFDVMPIRQSVSEIFSEIPAEERAQFTSEYGSLFKDIRKNPEMSPTAMQTTLRDINDAITAAGKAGYDARSRLLIELRNGIQETMDATHPLYAKARGLNKAARDKYASGKLKNALKDDAEPELFAQTLGLTDTRGAVTSRRLENMNAPGMPAARFENIKALAQAEGGATPKFMQKYRAEIDALRPQERQLFDNYVQTAQQQADAAAAATTAGKQAGRAIREAGKVGRATAAKTSALKNAVEARKNATAAEGKALKQAVETKSQLAEYGSKPKEVLQRLLTGKTLTDKIPQLRSLNNSLTKMGRGAEFKAAVGDSLQEQLLKTGADANELSRSLVESKVLTLDEVNEIRRATNKQKTMAQRKAAARIHFDASGDELVNLMASGGAATALPLLPAGQSLVMANALRRYFKHALTDSKTTPAEILKLEEFIMNPQSYVAAAEKARTAAEASRMILSSVVGAGNAAAIIKNEEEK